MLIVKKIRFLVHRYSKIVTVVVEIFLELDVENQSIARFIRSPKVSIANFIAIAPNKLSTTNKIYIKIVPDKFQKAA